MVQIFLGEQLLGIPSDIHNWDNSHHMQWDAPVKLWFTGGTLDPFLWKPASDLTAAPIRATSSSSLPWYILVCNQQVQGGKNYQKKNSTFTGRFMPLLPRYRLHITPRQCIPLMYTVSGRYCPLVVLNQCFWRLCTPKKVLKVNWFVLRIIKASRCPRPSPQISNHLLKL